MELRRSTAKKTFSLKRRIIIGLASLGVMAGGAITAVVLLQDDPKTIEPLKQPASPVKVAIIKDTAQNIPQMVQNAVTQSLGPQGMKAIVKQGNTVFIHPNVVYVAVAKDHKIADYRIVQALVALVKDAGAGKVILGEGTSTGNTDSAMKTGGYTKENFPDCELVDLNDTTLQRYEVTLVDGFAVGPTAKKRLPKLYLDADVVIGISKMKTHICAGMTGATKLVFGIPPYPLYAPSPVNSAYNYRLKLHDYLHQNIVDLNLVRVPDFSVMDALIAMDGQGPGSGKAKRMDLILAGRDPVAVDAVACGIMDIPTYRITHLVLAANMNVGILDMNKIDVVGESIASVKSPFKRAYTYKGYGNNNYCATAPVRPRKANAPVTIDGNLAEYAKATAIEANTLEQMVKGDTATWGGPADGSLTAKIMYDSSNMYFGITVLDSAKKPNPGTGADIENGSAIEIYLSSNWPRFTPANAMTDTNVWNDTTYVANRDYRIGFSFAETPKVHVFSNPTQTISGIEVKKVDTDAGYIMEIKLPFSMFASFTMSKCREVGLNVVVDKAGSNGTRKNKIAWEPNRKMETNSTAMGVGYLFPDKVEAGVEFFHNGAPEFLKANRPSLSITPSSFSGSTKLSFTVPDYRKAGRHKGAELSIFSLDGKKVATLLSKRVLPGRYDVLWNGDDASGRKLGAGNYVCKLTVTGEKSASAKVSIVR